MSRTGRELSEQERRKVAEEVPQIADLLVRLGRAYVNAVRAPSRDVNEGDHARFTVALQEFVVLLIESGGLD